jgi:thiamine biosynthesis protein ThiS
MITVNDNKHEYIKGSTISTILKKLNYIFPMLVVRKNGKLVPRNRYDSVVVEDGDRIDIIYLISGG